MDKLTEQDFDGQRLQRDGDWAVLFSAGWCPYCQAFQPQFETAEKRAEHGMAHADLSDEQNPLWDRFAVRTVPTLVAFRDGKAIWRKDATPMIGLRAKALKQLRQIFAGEQPPPPPRAWWQFWRPA